MARSSVPAREPPKFYETREFKKLQRQWDRKLRAAGFKDIEPLNANGSRNTPFLKDHSLRFAKRYKPVQEDYYRLAGQFAADYTSPLASTLTQTQRFLWGLHAEGMDMVAMRRLLRQDAGARVAADLTRVPRYWTLKRMLAKTRKVFKAWALAEPSRDREDREANDAWVASMAGVQYDYEV